MLLTLRRFADFFRGKKTYLVAAATFIYGAGIAAGFWRHQPGIDFLLTGGGLATVRAAIGKIDATGNARAGAVPGVPLPSSTWEGGR